jgi:copper chaperone
MTTPPSSPSIAVANVAGMSCAHCVSSVHGEVAAIDGVTSVDVVLETGTVTITSETPVTEASVRAAVEEAGYELTGLARAS